MSKDNQHALLSLATHFSQGESLATSRRRSKASGAQIMNETSEEMIAKPAAGKREDFLCTLALSGEGYIGLLALS